MSTAVWDSPRARDPQILSTDFSADGTAAKADWIKIWDPSRSLTRKTYSNRITSNN